MKSSLSNLLFFAPANALFEIEVFTKRRLPNTNKYGYTANCSYFTFIQLNVNGRAVELLLDSFCIKNYSNGQILVSLYKHWSKIIGCCYVINSHCCYNTTFQRILFLSWYHQFMRKKENLGAHLINS